MTHEALKRMYQLLLTEPHAPTLCNQLERIAREALAEHAMRETQRLGQEIEPVADDIASILACRNMLDAQPVPPRTEQEPVAWIDAFGNVFPLGAQRGPKWLNEPMKPLYTTPPQRTWVGLTGEEIEQGCKESWVTEQAFQSAVWWAEAKLKEKNT